MIATVVAKMSGYRVLIPLKFWFDSKCHYDHPDKSYGCGMMKAA